MEMSEKSIDLDKFDDLSNSEILAKYREFGIESFKEEDRPKVLDMLLKHERNQKSKQAFLKIILALFSLVPTVLLWLSNVMR